MWGEHTKRDTETNTLCLTQVYTHNPVNLRAFYWTLWFAIIYVSSASRYSSMWSPHGKNKILILPAKKLFFWARIAEEYFDLSLLMIIQRKKMRRYSFNPHIQFGTLVTFKYHKYRNSNQVLVSPVCYSNHRHQIRRKCSHPMFQTLFAGIVLLCIFHATLLCILLSSKWKEGANVFAPSSIVFLLKLLEGGSTFRPVASAAASGWIDPKPTSSFG